MVRLFFRNGPFDGGTADVESEKPTKPKRKGARQKCVKRHEPRLPQEAYVAVGEAAWFVWCYKISRTITPYSAEYTLAGWVKLADVQHGRDIIIIAP